MINIIVNKWFAGKNNQKFYYILFFVLFGLFFVFNLLSLPKEMDERGMFDENIRFLEYKNTNNLSLEKAFEDWDAIIGEKSRSLYITTYITGSPFYSLIRFYLLKLPIHPVVTFNIFNLIVAILFFYAAYLLIKLLFDNIIAIKSLIIMLSFYGVYTVTRFSGRGYIVIGLAFILFGCYFIWKSMLSGKQYYLIYAGIFMGLSWTAGNHMTKLTPGFLIITSIFYTFNYFKQNNFSFKNLLKLFLNFFFLVGSFTIISVVIIKIMSYKFNLDFSSLLLQTGFMKDRAVGSRL